MRRPSLAARLNPSPAARLACGLAAMTVCLFLLLDLALGLTTQPAQVAGRLRMQTAQLVSLQVAAGLASSDRATLEGLLRRLLADHDDLRSIAVRRESGALLAATTGHADAWMAMELPHGPDRLVLPIRVADRNWGQVELTFRGGRPAGLRSLLHEPALQALAALSICGAVAFYLYLRRALQYLDPGSAVPERVRAAFDTLTEGLLVLDTRQRVVLANQAFRRLQPVGTEAIAGRPIGAIDWLVTSFGDDPATRPWSRAMNEGRVVGDQSLSLHLPGWEAPRHFTVKASPIVDQGGSRRGCLVTFDDVTRLHEMNQAMRRTLQDLEASRLQVQQQNDELQRLASRDPLTGCLNRRSFFAGLAELPADETLALIMCDVDHFKSFNDRFGHAVGDQVLVAMGRLLGAMIRKGDLLCRMGGEEFCIAARGLDTAQVTDLAERVRAAVEADAGRALDIGEPQRVTASFGVVATAGVSMPVDHLLERADRALYQAKRAGRNRVVAWPIERVDLSGDLTAVV